MARALHWIDYIVFGLTIMFSIAVGIYYAAKERKMQNKTEEYLLAGRKMGVLPVALSIHVSWVSAISFLGKLVSLKDSDGELIIHARVYIKVPCLIRNWT